MIRVTSSLLLALTLAACGGSDGTTDVGDDAEIAVRSTGAAQAPAGETLTFTASLTNDGPAESGQVTLKHAVTGLGTLAGIACAATGDAECPSTLGPDMTVDSLPVGGGLIFTISVSTTADQIGVVTSALIASADNDPDDTNNRGESTTLTYDARNGDYTVYGSNGRQYTLSLDFKEMSYQMTGQQVNRSGTFTRDADGVGYVFDAVGTARFRTATDLVVGGFDFNLNGSNHAYDHGVRPFVAARKFVTDVAGLSGQSFNQMGLNLRRSADHPTESRVLPSTVDGSVLKVCTAPLPVRVSECPNQFLANYDLSAADGVFSGVDDDNDDAIRFRVALSGSNRILLRAEDAADATGRHFRVGLTETTGLAGGSFGTSNSGTAWGTTTLTSTRYTFLGTRADGSTASESADLSPLTNVGPTGLRRGNRTSDSAPIYLGQNDALMLMLGAADDLAEGTMDIGLR